MRTLDQLLDKLAAYHNVEYIYVEGEGYIAWRYSTGMNIEFLFVEVAAKRKGFGIAMFRRMVERISVRNQLPYHSVFGFRLQSNWEAGEFYDRMGFTQVPLGPSIYRDGGTVLMWTTWDKLKERVGL